MASIEASVRPRSHSLAAAIERVARHGLTALEPLAVIVGALGVILILGALGYSIGGMFEGVWQGSLATGHAIQSGLGYCIPLGLVGVAVWLAYEPGLFNIGCEGQLQWGAIGGVLVALHFNVGPSWFIIVVALLCGAVGGAGWAAIAGLMKVGRGANEVISTLMLTYIAVLLVEYLVTGPMTNSAEGGTATSPVPDGVRLNVVVGALIGLGLLVAALIVVRRTRVGITMRAVGANPAAARQAGVPVGRVWFGTMCASGAIAGIAGALVILCVQYRVSGGWSLNWGLLGIAVAFLSVRRPVLLLPWALIFGLLQASGPPMKALASVPDGGVTVILIAPLIAYFLLQAGFSAIEHAAAKRTGGRT